MKDEHLFFNPFRMLSPKLEYETVRIEELHEKPVSKEISLEEGLLIMISKLIEMCTLLSKCVFSGSMKQMERCEAFAQDVHAQEKILTKDLVESEVKGDLLKGLIRFPYRLERVGDLFESVLNCCRFKAKYSIPFTDKAYAELEQLFTTLREMLNNLRDAIRTPNKVILEAIIADGKKVNQMFEDFKLAHWQRLEAGFCAVEASSMYRDILDSMKSIGDYIVKMAETLMEMDKDSRN